MAKAKKSAYERMMERVFKCSAPTPGLEDPCWLFQGARDQNGHGNVRALVNGRWSCQKAHAVSYEHHYGKPLPKGRVHRHRCDVRNCVQPTHIEPGTQAQNVRDMIERGRAANQYGPYAGRGENYTSLEDAIAC